MVHLGHEGEVFVIADDVPHALALIAASGDNDEGLIYALTYGDAEPVELAQDLRQFDFMSPWEGADCILPGDEKVEDAK